MIGVTGGVDNFDDPDCRRCRGQMRERRSGKPCLRCKGTGDEPDTRREIPCPNCRQPITWRFHPEYDNERWQYVVCGACATDYHLVHVLDVVKSLTRADLPIEEPKDELTDAKATDALSGAFDKLMRRG